MLAIVSYDKCGDNTHNTKAHNNDDINTIMITLLALLLWNSTTILTDDSNNATVSIEGTASKNLKNYIDVS